MDKPTAGVTTNSAVNFKLQINCRELFSLIDQMNINQHFLQAETTAHQFDMPSDSG